MGVRGLKTYLERHCPKACYEVNISQLVSDHENQTGNRAEIVVDAHSCFSLWYQYLDWTIGLEVQKLINNLRSFVASFENIDVDLVFFIGGLTPEKKRSTWLRRRRANMHKMMNVSGMLKSGRSYNTIPEEWDYIPPNMTNFVAFVLKHVLNCTVHFTVDECDEEIIQYVEENDCLAIFSLDTDFIVSNVDCYVLSAHDFDSSQMTTTLYDRNELCEYLNIEKEHLPLLAILAGNDYIHFETLREFHIEKCNFPSNYTSHIPYKTLFSSLADYINTLPSFHDTCSDELMETVCWDVFEDDEKKEEMKQAYNSYFPKSRSVFLRQRSIWSRVLSVAEPRFRQVLLPVSAWGVLSRQVYECSPCLEDLRFITDENEDPEKRPSATITRPLRQRLYGILLFEIRHSNPLVTEWCGENKESYEEPVIVHPQYIRAHHPGLRALWDTNRSATQYRHKWILFLKGISSNRPINNIGTWMDLLPSDLIVSTAACYYLYMEEDFMGIEELRTVLATLALYPSFDCDYLDAVYDGRCNQRAIQISVVFSRTFSLVFSLLASCGYPEPLTEETAHIKLEPKLFQDLYKKVGNQPGYDRLYGHCECKERYELMFDAIHG
ncbi:hypothetical protein V9T40_007139 [Parthenolecanium corni]|uniref:Constitutive coactivator of peroxisome proliferator-activated receptor gamma n=1 Tax=Parthenolecanium corni TaxID=536013 RepID=A0AAN9TXZ4_9HEMI